MSWIKAPNSPSLLYKMKVIISKHAIEKHLDANHKDASIFFNIFMMDQCVELCLNNPDSSIEKGKRVELIKRFPFAIGLISSRKRESHTVKVIYTRTLHKLLVISTYPIRDKDVFRRIHV